MGMDNDEVLKLFKRCGHQHLVWDPDGWAANNVKIPATCQRFVGDALANGCGVEDCPSKPAEPLVPEPEDRKDVHTEHCCKKCCCKYHDRDCTVMTGERRQSFKHRETSVCYDLDEG